MRSNFSLPALILFACLPLRAVELHIRYAALERILAEQVFTDEGRRYLGTRHTRCNFAYLQNPRVQGDSGKLRITARFTGRTALDVLGACVGLGDQFDLAITARPQLRGDAIVFTDVAVASAGRTGYYIRRVCTSMTASLQRDFLYPIAAEAKRMLEDPASMPAYPREVRNFSVRNFRVGVDELMLDLDFQVTVK